jgi:GNAT superfamily N-acetyltransferase
MNPQDGSVAAELRRPDNPEDTAMQAIYAEGTSLVRADPSVVELSSGSASRKPSVNATRPYILRLDSEHEAQLSALLCGLDKSARTCRFGHPASDACVQSYAKEAAAGAAYMAGAFDAGQLIGVIEVFAARDGVGEVAFAIDADWRRQGLGSALLEAATRWAEQAGVATLRMVISRNNWPMRQLAHKAGARLDLYLDEIFADVSVTTAASLDIAA